MASHIKTNKCIPEIDNLHEPQINQCFSHTMKIFHIEHTTRQIFFGCLDKKE